MRPTSVRSILDLDARFYRDHVNEHARFEARIARFLRPEHRVLDVGAGGGERHPYAYRTRLVVGVDVEPAVGRNPNVDAGVLGDIAALPFGDVTFDLVRAKYVLEHLRDPAAAFREIRRVLRPGGRFVLHTTNRFHYVALAARITPHRFHVWFNAKRGCSEEESFETAYRVNDRFTLGRLATRTRFRVRDLELFEPKPLYLFFHPLAYRTGIAYERLVSRTEALRDLRAVILGELEAV